jgi:hypothetical protein
MVYEQAYTMTIRNKITYDNAISYYIMMLMMTTAEKIWHYD